MTNNGDALALVEKTEEPDTELLDSWALSRDGVLKELHDSRHREKQLESELEASKSELKNTRKQYGGKKMGLGSKLLGIGLLAGAAYGLIDGHLAKKETEQVRNDMYTSSELVEFDTLKTELGIQLESASKYLDKAKDAEIKYKQLTSDAVAYIEASKPSGELEDAAEEKIQNMVNFFGSCNIDSFIEQIENCGTAHQEMKVITSTKQELQDSVRHANAVCEMGYRSLGEHSGDVRMALRGFRDYVKSHPLKGRAGNMVERIDEQLSLRPGIAKEARMYSWMFSQNNLSEGVIPVEVQQNYKTAKAD